MGETPDGGTPFFNFLLKMTLKQKNYLKKLNREIKEYDLIRALKKTSKRDYILDKQNLLLSGNPGLYQAKKGIKKFLQETYGNESHALFFTQTYANDRTPGFVQNQMHLDKFISFVKKKGILRSVIIFPEYHNLRTVIHNHGIIAIQGNRNINSVIEIIKNYWTRYGIGEIKSEKFDSKRNFSEYLMKFYTEKSTYQSSNNRQGIIMDKCDAEDMLTEDVELMNQTVAVRSDNNYTEQVDSGDDFNDDVEDVDIDLTIQLLNISSKESSTEDSSSVDDLNDDVDVGEVSFTNGGEVSRELKNMDLMYTLKLNLLLFISGLYWYMYINVKC